VLACSPPVEEMMGLNLGSVKKVLDKDHADPLNVQLLIVGLQFSVRQQNLFLIFWIRLRL
jgi:hypothetical protein